MENNIQVSVFCSAYNHEKYIRQALDGFVMQKTNFAFEVIVHDDASTDGTADIIREYEKKYPEIIKPIYQTENLQKKGISRLFAFMLPAARGKYIAICEGDDYWTDPDKLQKQFDYMENHSDCSLVAHTASTYHEDTKKFVPYTTKFDFTVPENRNVSTAMLISDHLIFPTASMFYKKEYYIRNRDFVTTIKSYDYVVKILLSSQGRVHVLPDNMSVYRKGSDGSWSERILNNPERFMTHIKESVENLNKINEYTDYRFDSEFKVANLNRMFDAYYALSDIKTLKKAPYSDLYKRLSFNKKAYLYLTRYAPWAASFGRRLYRKIKHKKTEISENK